MVGEFLMPPVEILGCCKRIEKNAKGRLNGIQLPITRLLSHRFKCNLQHHNIKANCFFERQKLTKATVERKGEIFGSSANQTFLNHSSLVHAKQNGLRICRIALKRKAILKVYKDPGSNPSGIRYLTQCSNF